MTSCFTNVQDYGAVGDGIVDDTSSLQSAINAAQNNGNIVLIPKGTYKFTETLNITSTGVCIKGTSMTGTVLLFDPPVSETPPVAIQIQAGYGSLSYLTLKTPRTKAAANVRNEIGIQSAGQFEFREIQVRCFDINVNIFDGWNRTFTNCEIIDGKTAGFKYAPVSGGWSCSGDSIKDCNIVGNGWTASDGGVGYTYQGAGIYLDGAYQMNIQHCIFEYNGKAFDIRNSPDVIITNCWNEANINNSTVRQCARFVGGWNFYNSTVDHLDCSASDIVWFDHQNVVQACNANNVIFSQDNGYINKSSIAPSDEEKNLIYNPKFIVDSEASFDGWYNGGFGSSIAPDASKVYNGGVSCYINMTAERESLAWTSGIPVTAGSTYTLSVASFYDGSIGTRDGFGVFLEYRPLYQRSPIQSILPSAINSWEVKDVSFTIPEGVTSVGVFFDAPNGGRFWFADPVFVHHDKYIRDDISFSYGTSGTAKYLQTKDSAGIDLGCFRIYDSLPWGSPNIVKSLKYKTEKATGWQFTNTSGSTATIAHDNRVSTVPLTIDCLFSMDTQDLSFSGNTELMIFNKPNSWCFKIGNNYKFQLDAYNASTSSWAGAISCKTKTNFQLQNEYSLESYGASQGLTTDGTYIYTSNNRTDINAYNVMKRKLDGTLIQGLTLPTDFVHPCGICCVAGILYVPTNNYPTETSQTRIYKIDTRDLSVVGYVDVVCSTGGGISGIAYKDGYFYACDWQTSGSTNIYIYDGDFNLVDSGTINTYSVQGIDIADNILLAASNSETSIISYDLDTLTRLSAYLFYAGVEGEDLCVTKDGTILHADVSTIREYCIAEGPASHQAGEHFERLTATIQDDSGTITYKLYRNGILQDQNSFSGTLNNLTTYGTIVNGNWGGVKLTKFKLKAAAISNSILVPTQDPREMFVKGRYNVVFLDGSIPVTSLVDSVSSLTVTKGSAVYNYNSFEV